MPAPDLSNERRGLRVSIWATGIIGVVGIVWGWLVGSQMILFDGVFAFIGVLVSMVLVGASAMAAAGPTRKYPYGREGVTPLAIFIQGFVILSMLAYAAVEAVYTIRDGGSDFEPGWAIVYAVATTAASVVVWLWLARIAGYSDLLVSEAAAWKVGAFRGVGMIVGFGVMAMLIDSAWDDAAPYVDHVLPYDVWLNLEFAPVGVDPL